MAGSATLDEVREYWNSQLNDIEVCQHPVGTLEFFDELEAYRYAKSPYLKDYLGFSRYRGAKLLEVGCGPGVDLLQFARAGADVWAIDLAPRAAELARRNLTAHGFGSKAHQVMTGNAEALDFPDSSFDVVYSHGVLHHTVNIERALDELRRVLRPAGEAIIMLYNRWSWFNLLAIASGTKIEHKDEDAPIVRRYSIRQCRRMMRRFGGPVAIHVDRFPKKTLKHRSALGKLYNSVLVPISEMVPAGVRRPFGWHINVRAQKGSCPG